MTTLQEATTASTPTMRLVERVSNRLGRFSRRGFLVRTAVVGSAIVVDPRNYVLTPMTASAAVGCGPAASCSAGYTVMCCTINKGVNACPPGTFTAGWWKAADSSWCCGGYRYITDCNARCSSCSSGCSDDNICSSGCWSCSCKCGSTSTCDQRRVCCNAFRYGQCNTQVKCSGGVACRVVSCVAPYKWANCTTTSLSDNATAEHNAPCLQGCGPILTLYNQLGANGSSLGASTGPERYVGDDRGKYVVYQHGRIYWAGSPGAHRVSGGIETAYLALGGPKGPLRYPTAEMVRAKDGEGYLQEFERGTLVRAPGKTARRVTGTIRTGWIARGRETGVLGYPRANMAATKDNHGYLQEFDHGLLVHASGKEAFRISGGIRTRWLALGQATSVLGYPTSDMRASAGGWRQVFTGGVAVDGPSTSTFVVRGRVLTAWTADGAESGRWGFPVEDTKVAADGTQSQRFQGGVLTA